MAKHTQAHLPRRIKKYKGGLDAGTKQQMEYYMGAKLLEVGVDPQSVTYRWSAKVEGDDEIWTYSAYWGDSLEQLLAEEAAKKAAKETANSTDPSDS